MFGIRDANGRKENRMRKTVLVLILGLAVAVLTVAGCGGDDEGGGTETETVTETGGAVEPGATLLGSVGPGFEISLTTEDGQDVTTIPAGSYTIVIDDRADFHNFHLSGPEGLDTATTVAEVTEVTWELELPAGSYEYVCDPHASSMNGSFEVTG
jgi:plastocyanin